MSMGMVPSMTTSAVAGTIKSSVSHGTTGIVSPISPPATSNSEMV